MKFIITNNCAKVAKPKLPNSIANKIKRPGKWSISLILIYIEVPIWLWSKLSYLFKLSHKDLISSNFNMSQVERVAKLASPMGRFKALSYWSIILGKRNSLSKCMKKLLLSNDTHFRGYYHRISSFLFKFKVSGVAWNILNVSSSHIGGIFAE